MSKNISPSSVTIGELTRIVKEFEEKIQNGTEDPERFLTLTEIEELWGKLIGETNVLYSDMLPLSYLSAVFAVLEYSIIILYPKF